MKTHYAKSEEHAESYIFAEYGNSKFGENKFRNHRCFFANEIMVEINSFRCTCGESPAYYVYDEKMNVVECIVVCEACYNNEGEELVRNGKIF